MEEALQLTMAKGFARLRFPEILEKDYRKKETAYQKRLFLPLGTATLILFLLYAIPDYFLFPDIYLEAWFLRFAVLAPLFILTLIAIRSPRVTKNVDILMLTALLSGTLTIIAMLIRSQAPISAHYHSGIVLSVILLAIGTRIRFPLNLTGCIFIFCVYAAALPFMSNMPTAAKLTKLLDLSSTIFLCLTGCYQLEYRQRRDYLETQTKKIDALRLSLANQQLSHISLSDSLTGLANRRHFDDFFSLQFRIAKRSGSSLALLFMDVDNFKAYNDEYGHPAGDHCLQAIARTIKTHNRRPSDLSARFGGEEFILLLPYTTQEQALVIGENIRVQVEKLKIPHTASLVAEHITLSIGLATSTKNMQEDAQDLLDRADKAMYQAKSNGKNRLFQG